MQQYDTLSKHPQNKSYMDAKESFKKYCTSTIAVCLLLVAYLAPVSAQSHDFAWAKSMGGKRADNGFRIKTDASGNVYIVGDFSDTADFDLGPGVFDLICKGSTGSVNAFVAKYDPAGNLIWAKAWGSRYTDRARDIFIDHFQNVYISGDFWDTVDFDPGPGVYNLVSKGLTDIFVTKLDSAGNFIWARSFGGKGDDDIGYAIGVDALGNVYTTGTFRDTVDFDPGPGIAELISTISFRSATIIRYSTDIFISKLDSAGNFIWAKSVGDIGDNEAMALALDTFANVYITGSFGATVDFDPGPGVYNLTSNGHDDAYILKLDSAGSFIWAKSMGGPGNDLGRDIALDTWGNVYTTGWFRDTADFDPGPDTAFLILGNNSNDIFISKLDSAGNFIWAKGVGGPGADVGFDITTDAAGNVYYSGRFAVIVDFDPGPGVFYLNTLSSSLNSTDICISKLDSAGNFIWAKSILGPMGTDYGYALTVDNSGNIYATGKFSRTADFDPGPDTFLLGTIYNGLDNGLGDVFLLKLSCNDTSSSFVTVLECGTDGYALNGEHYTQSGIYTQKHPNTSGCDSTVTIDLTIDPLPTPVIRVDNFTLSITATYNTYQWFLNEDPIPGATNNSYTVTQNGDYKVVVTNTSGCSDTSDIYPINNVNIHDTYNTEHVRIYPNPASNEIFIQTSMNIEIIFTSIEGKVLRHIKNPEILSIKDLPDGLYLLHIADREGNIFRVEKLVKQNRQ